MGEIHREHPDASPEEIERLQFAALLGPPIPPVVPNGAPFHGLIRNQCRSCGDEFWMGAELEGRPGKWANSCVSCLSNEL